MVSDTITTPSELKKNAGVTPRFSVLMKDMPTNSKIRTGLIYTWMVGCFGILMLIL